MSTGFMAADGFTKDPRPKIPPKLSHTIPDGLLGPNRKCVQSRNGCQMAGNHQID